MNLDPDRFPDTRCYICRTGDESEPVVARAMHPDGTYKYYCESHIMDLFRFGDRPDETGNEPLAVVCPSCGKLTLRGDTGINKCCIECEPPFDVDVVSDEELVRLAEAVKRGEVTE